MSTSFWLVGEPRFLQKPRCEKVQRLPESYLQPRDLLSEALLLLGQDALVQLGVGLHDALLGRQHFLEVEILTRADATTERRPRRRTGRQTDGRTMCTRGSRTEATHRPNTRTCKGSNKSKESNSDTKGCMQVGGYSDGGGTHTCTN